MIDNLIDKQDNFEIIRDQIAAILVAESVSQQALAVTAGKDPALWKLRVFTERANPWEEWLNEPTDLSPIISVWFDNTSYDPKASNVMERQKTDGVFNIDCYGYGEATDNPSGGFFPGDEAAALAVQRAFRLVRNILMAAEYTSLGLRGLVWGRWPQSGTAFQPQLDSQTVQQVSGLRMAMRVTFNEFSPQVTPEALELLSIDVKRAENGEILMEADYDYTV